MSDPETIVEQLDSAETGEEWGAALLGWITALGREQDK